MTSSVSDVLKGLRRKNADLFVDPTKKKPVQSLSTGSYIVDLVTGVGGIPKGKITEIFGIESIGKSLLAQGVSAALLRSNPEAVCVYADFEHTIQLDYSAKLGIDVSPDRFILLQPQCGEEVEEVVFALIENDLVDLIIIDSITTMYPKEAKGRLGEHAAYVSSLLKRLNPRLDRGRQPALVLLSQMRNKIDLQNARNNGLDSSAGMALRHHAALRLRMDLVRRERDEGKQAGSLTANFKRQRVRITSVKNKVADPWKRAEVTIDFGGDDIGINNYVSLAELAKDHGLIGSVGNFAITCDDGNLIQGRGIQNFIDLLKTNSSFYHELVTKLTPHSVQQSDLVNNDDDSEFYSQFISENDVKDF